VFVFFLRSPIVNHLGRVLHFIDSGVRDTDISTGKDFLFSRQSSRVSDQMFVPVFKTIITFLWQRPVAEKCWAYGLATVDNPVFIMT
jgi:hypothetical protein